MFEFRKLVIALVVLLVAVVVGLLAWAKAEGREAKRAEGLRIAAESLARARSFREVRGACIFPPFGRYSAASDVLRLVEEAEKIVDV